MEFIEQIQDVLKDHAHIVAVFSIALGILNCYFGYKIFKFVLGIVGFCAGFLTAGALGMIIFGGETSVAFLLAVFGGIIGAFFMVMFYKFGIFILGAGLGAFLSIMITGTAGQEANIFLITALALAGGITALLLQKLMIIIATSFGGSWGIVSGAFSFFGKEADLTAMINQPEILKSMGWIYYLMLLLWLIIGFSGVFFQAVADKKRDGGK